jgi:hypothetical protein
MHEAEEMPRRGEINLELRNSGEGKTTQQEVTGVSFLPRMERIERIKSKKWKSWDSDWKLRILLMARIKFHLQFAVSPSRADFHKKRKGT